MSTRKLYWPVRLAAAAKHDFQEILRWTAEQFGEKQARIFAKTLSAALEELSAGPKISGARALSEIVKGLFMSAPEAANKKIVTIWSSAFAAIRMLMANNSTHSI